MLLTETSVNTAVMVQQDSSEINYALHRIQHGSKIQPTSYTVGTGLLFQKSYSDIKRNGKKELISATSICEHSHRAPSHRLSAIAPPRGFEKPLPCATVVRRKQNAPR